MEEKKFLGMPKKVCLGLSWLTLVIGIIALAVDHEKMNKEDKKQIVSVFVAFVLFFIFITITGIVQAILHIADVYAVDWLFTVLDLVAWLCLSLLPMIFAFVNEDFHCPIAFNIAGNFVKDGEEAKPEAKEEAPKEEAAPAEEEKKEE